MSIFIRKASSKDCVGILKLLDQIAKQHHVGRPDLFKDNVKKYTDNELIEIINNEKRPVFVAHDDSGTILGYCFLMIIKKEEQSNIFNQITSLYIDDFCVDENIRGQQIGTKIFSYVYQFAKDNGIYNIDLNVWEFNESAIKFYEKCGFKPQRRFMEIIL